MIYAFILIGIAVVLVGTGSTLQKNRFSETLELMAVTFAAVGSTLWGFWALIHFVAWVIT